MHIVIIGAGIAGIAAYLHLRAHLANMDAHSFVILESHISSSSQDGSLRRLSGGLGVGPNGMRALRHLSASIHAEVEALGFRAECFEFKTESGWTIGRWPAKATTDNEATVMIDRNVLWQVLRKQVPDEIIREGANVERVCPDGTVTLADGEILKADIVVGADGVRSVARLCVVGEGEQGREPEFQNLMNVGGSVPSSYLRNLSTPSAAPVVMTFGSTGFVGYSLMSSKDVPTGQHGPGGTWWSTYVSSSSPSEVRTVRDPGNARLRLEMRQRHHTWADPTIQQIIKDLLETTGDEDAIESEKADLNLYKPTWIVRKIPRWHRGRVILVGDAAHALPSTSGQGVSQAFEDAATLSILLSREVDKRPRIDDEAVARVASKYEQLRKPRVNRILDSALRSQSGKQIMSLLDRAILYFILWFLIKIGRGKQEAWRYDYDIVKQVEHLQKEDDVQ